MAARVVPAVAVLTAAAAVVYTLHHHRVRQLRRQLARERATHHLVAGCMARDLERFRDRLDQAMAQDRVAAAAGRVLDEALATHNPMTPPSEGGTP